MRKDPKRRGKSFVIMVGFWMLSCSFFPGESQAIDLLPGFLKQDTFVQVKVLRLIVDPMSKQPVVMLADSQEERALPIWIDLFAANAIQSELQGINHRRPLTHDLLERVIQNAHLTIRQIVITHLKEGIYHAIIKMEREGALIEVDARPSDSIVLALKFKVPIYVSQPLFKDKSIPIMEPEEAEEQYGLRIQNLTPSLAEAFSFGSTSGILVSDVRKGSRAEKDGIERGDIFREVGEHIIEDKASMRVALERIKTPVKAKIYRKGRFLTIDLHPD